MLSMALDLHEENMSSKSALLLSCVSAAAFILCACDNRPRVESDRLPFSVGNVRLGMSKSDAAKTWPLNDCSQEKDNLASCRINPLDKRVIFMGSEVRSISLNLLNPYQTIDQIKIEAAGNFIYDRQLEAQWDLKGRCLNYFSAQEVGELSQNAKVVMRLLLEMNAYPTGLNDSLCLSKFGQFIFIKSDEFEGKKTQWIDMHRASEATIRMLEHAFEFKEQVGRFDIN